MKDYNSYVIAAYTVTFVMLGAVLAYNLIKRKQALLQLSKLDDK